MENIGFISYKERDFDRKGQRDNENPGREFIAADS